jgi:hypothetical protein
VLEAFWPAVLLPLPLPCWLMDWLVSLLSASLYTSASAIWSTSPLLAPGLRMAIGALTLTGTAAARPAAIGSSWLLMAFWDAELLELPPPF